MENRGAKNRNKEEMGTRNISATPKLQTEGLAGQGRAGQRRAGQGRAVQGRGGQGRPRVLHGHYMLSSAPLRSGLQSTLGWP